MIQNLSITGFKSFISEDIIFGNLTLLTGLNSSGKSSVIQSLQLLEKASKGEDIYLEGHGKLVESRNPFVDDGIYIVCELDNEQSLGIDNENAFLSDELSFPQIIHISADRFGPETSIPIDNRLGSKLGKKGENLFKCIEINADKQLPEILRHENSEGDTFLFNLRGWLSIISPNVAFESFIEEKSDSSYSTFNGYRSKNVGFGLSYSLPIITALLLGVITKNSIVIIENPEAHLHPRGQTEMGRLIGLCIEAGAQILVETHSDHLFDSIRLFAKNSKNAFYEKVRAYWFELDKQRNTEVTAVLLDKDGRVENWPEGMFDQFSINASKLL